MISGISGTANQVTDQVKKARPYVAFTVTAAALLVVIAAAIGSIGGARVIHANQATSLSLFSGKAAITADKSIIASVDACGKQTHTITSVRWTGPPIRVTGTIFGSGTMQAESSCLAGYYLKFGPTAQACPAVAQSSAGSSAADAPAYVEQFLSCESAVGGS